MVELGLGVISKKKGHDTIEGQCREESELRLERDRVWRYEEESQSTGIPRRYCGLGSRPLQSIKYCNKASGNVFASGGSKMQHLRSAIKRSAIK